MVKTLNKTKLKDRKGKVKNKKGFHKYIVRDKDNFQLITQVFCKGCGTQIGGLNGSGQLIEYWNYRTMTIEFDDNSAHMTPVCVKCEKIKDKEVLEAIYMADLEEIENDDPVQESKVWDLYLRRTPQKIKD